MSSVFQYRWVEQSDGAVPVIDDETLEALRRALANRAVDPMELIMRHVLEKESGVGRPWAIVLFPQSMDVAGHIAEIRGQHRHAAMTTHGKMLRGRRPQTPVHPVDGVLVDTRGSLKRLAERSPLFVSAWAALGSQFGKGVSWICLSEAVPPSLVAELEQNNQARYREVMRHECPQITIPEGDAYRIHRMQHAAIDAAIEARAPDTVVPQLRALTQAYPHLAVPWYWLGQALRVGSEQEDARHCFELAAGLARRWIDPRLVLGAISEECHRKDDALRWYEEIWQIDPLGYEYMAVAAAGLQDLGDFGASWSLLRRALEVEDGSTRLWSDAGITLMQLGRVEESVLAFERAVQLNPGCAVTWNNLAYVLANVGRLEDALACCRRSIEIDERLPVVWDTLGHVHLLAGRCIEALDPLTRAVKLRPNYPEAWINLATAYRLLGELDKARQAEAMAAGHSGKVA